MAGASDGASVRAATIFNIRNMLMGAVATLSLFGMVISGYVLKRANAERAVSAEAAEVNETADLLLQAAGNWARERGATNLSLNAPTPATDQQVSAIANFRKAADGAFADGLARLKDMPFAERDKLLGSAQQAFDRLVALRRQADIELTRSGQSRDRAVVAQLAPAVTAVIVASQNLRVAAAMDEDDVQSRLASLQSLKHFVWVISEFAGRETGAGFGDDRRQSADDATGGQHARHLPRPRRDCVGVRAGLRRQGLRSSSGRHGNAASR